MGKGRGYSPHHPSLASAPVTNSPRDRSSRVYSAHGTANQRQQLRAVGDNKVITLPAGPWRT